MDERLVEQIRRDLDLLFPDGGYALSVQPGEPPLKLMWDRSVDGTLRRASEQILRKHKVAFETEGDPASRRRAMRMSMLSNATPDPRRRGGPE